MSLAETVLDAFLKEHTRYPPASVMVAFQELCEAIRSENQQTVDALAEVLQVVNKYLPDSYKADFQELRRQANNPYDTMTVPLYDVIDVARPIVSILYHYIHERHPDHELRGKLLDNENGYHGVTNLSRRKKFIPPPTQVEEKPQELIRIYLRGTPFYDFLMYTQVPFVIPRKTWSSHGIVLAPSGHGKTQLLGSLIADFLRDESTGLFVLDPHGDLFNTLRSRVASSRLVVLDPDTSPPPLNFLDFGNSTEAATLQTFSYLMSSLSGGLSDKQSAIVPYLLKLLRNIPGASFETLRNIVDEKPKVVDKSAFAAFIANLPETDRGFFHNQFYSSRMQETKDAIGWKLYAALSSDAFRKMFAPQNCDILNDVCTAQSATQPQGLSSNITELLAGRITTDVVHATARLLQLTIELRAETRTSDVYKRSIIENISLNSEHDGKFTQQLKKAIWSDQTFAQFAASLGVSKHTTTTTQNHSTSSGRANRATSNSTKRSLDFDQLIAERKVVVVKGGFDSLGEEGMRVFLQFLVAQYYAAGMRRLRLPERDRHLNLFICDEASHILTTPIVARMLFDLRKVACGFLGATQVWEQVATEVKAAVLGNTAIKIVGPVQHNDASVLSREMYCDIDFIRGMQRSDNQKSAPWAMYVTGMTKKAVRVTVPFGVLERMPKQKGEAAASPYLPARKADAGASIAHTTTLPQEPPMPYTMPEEEEDNGGWEDW